ncbi:hypothetical protein ACRAWF_27630 [Streptomyces sp. L7]
MQQDRFRAGWRIPLRLRKLSPMDLESITHWEDYSRAKRTRCWCTPTASSPRPRGTSSRATTSAGPG